MSAVASSLVDSLVVHENGKRGRVMAVAYDTEYSTGNEFRLLVAVEGKLDSWTASKCTLAGAPAQIPAPTKPYRAPGRSVCEHDRPCGCGPEGGGS